MYSLLCLNHFVSIVISHSPRSHVKERHAQKLWAIEFNNFLQDDQPKIFATLGGAQFSIYECTEKGTIKLLMRFVDPDVSVLRPERTNSGVFSGRGIFLCA